MIGQIKGLVKMAVAAGMNENLARTLVEIFERIDSVKIKELQVSITERSFNTLKLKQGGNAKTYPAPTPKDPERFPSFPTNGNMIGRLGGATQQAGLGFTFAERNPTFRTYWNTNGSLQLRNE